MNIDHKLVKLQIWDTAGQERFHTVTSSYYHNADGVIIVYDVANRQSFDAVERWNDELEKYVTPDVCKLLVGNKSDHRKKNAGFAKRWEIIGQTTQDSTYTNICKRFIKC